MKEKEKIKTATSAAASAVKAKIDKGAARQETKTEADMEIVKGIIAEWGSFPKKAAEDTIKKYGPPQEAIPSQLIWYNNGPWKRTRVLRDEIPHNFPQPHSDVVENVIDYKVPPEKYDKLAKFDGSLYLDRTRGEAAARCDMEGANKISLNLMHDIVTGKSSVEEARERFGEIASAYLMNRSAPYAEELQFEVSQGYVGDQDEAKIAGAMMDQAAEKLKDKIGGGS